MFGWKNIITYHPKTYFLSLKNLRISPKPGLAPKPSYVFKSKNSKMWDPCSDLVMWLCRWGCSCGSKYSLELLVGSTKRSCGFDYFPTVRLADVRVFMKLPPVTHHPIWYGNKTHPNKHLLHGTHLFWVISVEIG